MPVSLTLFNNIGYKKTPEQHQQKTPNQPPPQKKKKRQNNSKTKKPTPKSQPANQPMKEKNPMERAADGVLNLLQIVA